MICFGSSSLKRSQVSASRCFESSAASRASWRRDSMSRYISRTLSDHWTIASRSSFWILPSVRRQRSFVSSRISSALAEVARLLELLLVDRRDELEVVLVDLRLLDEQPVEDTVDVLREGALLRPGRLRELLVEPLQRLPDLDGDGRHRLQLLRGQPAIVADRGVADELADLLRVFGRDLVRNLDEELGDELPRFLEWRDALLLGPVGEAAGPELVVLIEVPLLALREELAAALEPVLERSECLVAVDVDALLLGLDLAFEVVQVLLPLSDVDSGDD